MPDEMAMGREPRVYSRDQLRARFTPFLRANALSIAGSFLLFASGGGLLSLALHAHWLGFCDGVLGATFVTLVGLVFLMQTDSFTQLGGAWGEEATQEVLSKAERHGHVWAVINRVELDGYDIDHVVLTPSGVVAIDSKWHFRASEATFKADANAAARSARSTRSVLRALGHIGDVTPLVVVSGPGRDALDQDPLLLNGVEIVGISALPTWLATRQTGGYPMDYAEHVAAALREFRAAHGPNREQPRGARHWFRSAKSA